MTVFNTYLKILNKNKITVIIYTIILLSFGGINMQTSEKSLNFVATKPSITIVNNDTDMPLTNHFIKYLEENTNIKEIENEDKQNDALFYNNIDYIIYIPKDFHHNLMMGKEFNIDIKKTNTYNGAYAQMIVNRYLEVVNNYQKYINDESMLIDMVDKALSIEVNTEFVSKIDSSKLSKATFYFNFVSYSVLACLIFIICMIMNVFNSINIRKRTIISSSDYKKTNRILLLSNFLYAITIWLLYYLISFIFIGNITFSSYGLLYMFNFLVFTICATTLAFLISNLLTKKEAISGVMNVIALGSSFLCGAFVPMEYLPDFVLKIGHIFPTYYFISNNEKIKFLENINMETLKSYFINIGIMLIFSIIFIILTNLLYKKKRKVG